MINKVWAFDGRDVKLIILFFLSFQDVISSYDLLSLFVEEILVINSLSYEINSLEL